IVAVRGRGQEVFVHECPVVLVTTLIIVRIDRVRIVAPRSSANHLLIRLVILVVILVVVVVSKGCKVTGLQEASQLIGVHSKGSGVVVQQCVFMVWQIKVLFRQSKE